MEKEKLLAERIRNDDVKAFRELFETYYGLLCHYASRILNDDGLAEEEVQEFFVRFWEKRRMISVESSLRSYLYRSVHNQCINRLRREKAALLRTGGYRETKELEEPQEESFISPELLLELERSIESLPEKRRAVFRLSREEGLTYKEIAEKLAISVKTVEAQMGLALKYLRERISKSAYLFFVFGKIQDKE